MHNALVLGILREYRNKYSAAESVGVFTSCNHIYVMRPETTEFGKITHGNRHYAVQSHSWSPILVPIERSYTTS